MTMSRHAGKMLLLVSLTTATIVGCGGDGNNKNSSGSNSPGISDPNSVSIVRGGLLWDNLWAATGKIPPAGNNPMWDKRSPTSTNTATGGDTWRCKECHGWDYKGADGNYGPANTAHYTGFPSVLARIQNRTQDEIRRYLKEGIADPNPLNPALPQRLHNFGTGAPALTDADIESLILFLFDSVNGVIDTDKYIYGYTGVARGDAARGLTLYTTGAGTSGQNCGDATCHGPNGTALDFDANPAATEYLGTLAMENPWEVLHKARFGQPGTPSMVPVFQWGGSIENAADIVAYAQTLPQQ